MHYFIYHLWKYLLFRINLKREEIKVENKGNMKFHNYYTFKKLTIISVTTEIMTALTNFVSNLPNTFGNNCPRKLMMQSLIN